MSHVVKYPMEVVRQALALLVANENSVSRTAEQIAAEPLLDANDEPYTVHATTLTKWRDDLYSETFQDIERRHAQTIEDEIVVMMRQRVHRAAELELEMMEKLAKTAHGGRDLSNALRAVADVKAKSGDMLLKMTGRTQNNSSGVSFEQLLESMAKSGYLKLNVSLEGPPVNPPTSGSIVDGTAEEG